LIGRIARVYNSGEISGAFDYHPLEQLYQQTIDAAEPTIGGAVQVSKVYRSIRVEHFATQVDEGLYVSGRPALDYENVDLRTISRSPDGKWKIQTGTEFSRSSESQAAQNSAVGSADVPRQLDGTAEA
jgi:hypothetical protein